MSSLTGEILGWRYCVRTYTLLFDVTYVSKINRFLHGYHSCWWCLPSASLDSYIWTRISGPRLEVSLCITHERRGRPFVFKQSILMEVIVELYVEANVLDFCDRET